MFQDKNFATIYNNDISKIIDKILAKTSPHEYKFAATHSGYCIFSSTFQVLADIYDLDTETTMIECYILDDNCEIICDIELFKRDFKEHI